jgi:hypothetical protein
MTFCMGFTMTSKVPQKENRRDKAGSALSAYLDKRNRFSEELGARPHSVCRFADLEDRSLDPGVIDAVLGGIFL